MAQTPTIEHAQGMLTALVRGHVCNEACVGTFTLGDGHVMQLSCPYARLRVENEADRRIIQSMYAGAARSALAGSRGVKA